MALRTRHTNELGIRHPVLLAPMGFVSDRTLATAISAAAGLGVIGVGYADPGVIREAETALARRFT
jgi:nitronate monooxygenase